MLGANRYSALPQDTHDGSSISRRGSWCNPKLNAVPILCIVLALSLGTNIFLISSSRRALLDCNFQSHYARLSRDKSIYWNRNTPYDNVDEVADELWQNISIDNGIIALSDEYATLNDLPLARRFPWDKNKGLYIIQGYHELHCLKLLRTSIMESHRGLNQTYDITHLAHCLGELRDDIICHADDTPNSSPFSLKKETTQIRWCRDWSVLDRWAQQHTACYSLRNSTVERAGDLENFRFCPEGSEYTEDVDAALQLERHL